MVDCLPFVETLSKKEASLALNYDGSGMKLTTWTCHCVKYLPWLRKKIEVLGMFLLIVSKKLLNY